VISPEEEEEEEEEGKATGTYHTTFICRISLKYGSLNLLEP